MTTTPRDIERRLHLLEGTARVRHPDPPRPLRVRAMGRRLEQWCVGAVRAVCRALADEAEHDDQPMGEFERDLVEVAVLDSDYGDDDSVGRSYLAYGPHDPADPAMDELRVQIDDWIIGADRVFMAGTDCGWWPGTASSSISSGPAS